MASLLFRRSLLLHPALLRQDIFVVVDSWFYFDFACLERQVIQMMKFCYIHYPVLLGRVMVGLLVGYMWIGIHECTLFVRDFAMCAALDGKKRPHGSGAKNTSRDRRGICK